MNPALSESILSKIVQQRTVALKQLQQTYPAAYIKQAAQRATESAIKNKTNLSLIEAVRYTSRTLQQPAFILECKKASPSKGLIRPHFDPVSLAQIYQPYATAISVLTEPDFFMGQFDYLAAVKTKVQCPVICKDFIFTQYQVALARYFGADAILLMLSILDDETYLSLSQYAKKLELDVLTEVANETEAKRALQLKAELVGINNRDLTTLAVDLNQTPKLAALFPKEQLIISESGIYTHSQVRALTTHADGFLVGSSLTAQENLDLACRKLVYGSHKICGLTQAEQAILAGSAGAVYGGLIFVSRSPRAISVKQAKRIVQTGQLAFVGVFSALESSPEDCLEIAGKLSLDILQIHDLDPHTSQAEVYLQTLQAAGKQVWFAWSVQQKIELLPPLPVDYFLLDQGLGGTGQVFNWQHLPQAHRDKIILAGGIGPNNCQAALALGCYALDMNSALEIKAGIKCPNLVQQALRICRSRLSNQTVASARLITSTI